MNKRDRKIVKQAMLWQKKGYKLHKEGNPIKLAAYEREYSRILDYRMADGHSEAVQRQLDHESRIRSEHFLLDPKKARFRTRYFYRCSCN